MSKLILNKWIPCLEDNYWTEESGYVTIVKFTIDGEYQVFTKESCPYGWNILESIDAELMNIKL